MEWIYIEDALPKQSGEFPKLVFVSVKVGAENYVTQATYNEKEKLWVDSELHILNNVYAWCYAKPAKERG